MHAHLPYVVYNIWLVCPHPLTVCSSILSLDVLQIKAMERVRMKIITDHYQSKCKRDVENVDEAKISAVHL